MNTIHTHLLISSGLAQSYLNQHLICNKTLRINGVWIIARNSFKLLEFGFGNLFLVFFFVNRAKWFRFIWLTGRHWWTGQAARWLARITNILTIKSLVLQTTIQQSTKAFICHQTLMVYFDLFVNTDITVMKDFNLLILLFFIS